MAKSIFFDYLLVVCHQKKLILKCNIKAKDI